MKPTGNRVLVKAEEKSISDIIITPIMGTLNTAAPVRGYVVSVGAAADDEVIVKRQQRRLAEGDYIMFPAGTGIDIEDENGQTLLIMRSDQIMGVITK